MTWTDVMTVVGQFFAAWASGYVAGYLFKAVRRVIETATGVGSG